MLQVVAIVVLLLSQTSDEVARTYSLSVDGDRIRVETENFTATAAKVIVDPTEQVLKLESTEKHPVAFTISHERTIGSHSKDVRTTSGKADIIKLWLRKDGEVLFEGNHEFNTSNGAHVEFNRPLSFATKSPTSK
jgi:hypothetical protein